MAKPKLITIKMTGWAQTKVP